MKGPVRTVTYSCRYCEYVQEIRYTCQGDSGVRVSCGHYHGEARHIADTSWATPQWCPLMAYLDGEKAAREEADVLRENDALRGALLGLSWGDSETGPAYCWCEYGIPPEDEDHQYWCEVAHDLLAAKGES